jgi:hypothetical protein
MLSQARQLGIIKLPAPSGIQIQMMPIVMHDRHSIPSRLKKWERTICKLMESINEEGVGYLTIDEARVQIGNSHRRPGLHIDGMGGWGASSPWAKGGMICVSSEAACNLYLGEVVGQPAEEGNCEHLRGQIQPTLQKRNAVWWLDGNCLHESLTFPKTTIRQFIRISSPSECRPYADFTKNPEGVPLENCLPARNTVRPSIY